MYFFLSFHRIELWNPFSKSTVLPSGRSQEERLRLHKAVYVCDIDQSFSLCGTVDEHTRTQFSLINSDASGLLCFLSISFDQESRNAGSADCGLIGYLHLLLGFWNRRNRSAAVLSAFQRRALRRRFLASFDNSLSLNRFFFCPFTLRL